MTVLMPIKRRGWRKSVLMFVGALVAILLVTSSFKLASETKLVGQPKEMSRSLEQGVRIETSTGSMETTGELEGMSSAEMNNMISRHLHICSTPHSSLPHIRANTSHPYHQLVSDGAKAVRTFIPKVHNPAFSNPCWFASMPALPSKLHNELTEYRGCMPDVTQKYTLSEALRITQTAVSTPAKSCNVNELLETRSALMRVIPPHCLNIARAQGYMFPQSHSPFIKSSVHTLSRPFANCVCKNELYCVPRVMLAGFPKCATTSLYYMIMKHPELARSRMKEAHFWRDFFTTSTIPFKQLQVLYYIYHFERASHEMVENRSHIAVDGSTTTLFPGLNIEIDQDEDICILPMMLTNMIPTVKFIVMMRNPIDRVYSDYWYLCSKFYWKDGRKITVPEDYLQNGTAMFHQASLNMISEYNKCVRGKSVFECVRRAGVGYAEDVACKGPRIGISLYYYHIIRWLNVLPRDRFIFLRTEDFLSNPSADLNSVYQFLGVSSMEMEIPMSAKNVNTWIKSSEYRKDFTMPEGTRKLLTTFFSPYNTLLSKLLEDEKFLWQDVNVE